MSSPSRFISDVSCPICFEVRPGSNVYICVNGHNVCAVCKGRLGVMAKCPMAGCAYNDPPTRNLTLESLIASSLLEFPCKNEAEGCLLKGTIGDLEEHDSCCQFRQVPCPMGCPAAATCGLVDLLDHLTDVHKVKKCVEVDSGEESSAIYMLAEGFPGRHWVVLRATEGETFLHCFRKAADGLFYAWVQVLGDRRVAERFGAVITMEGRNEIKYQMACRVHAVDRGREAISEELECFNLTERQVMQAMVENETESKKRGFTHTVSVSYLVGRNDDAES